MRTEFKSILSIAVLSIAGVIAPHEAQAGYTICFLPKFVGHPVFTQANEGAQAAGNELGDKVIYAGSTEINVARQIEWVETCTKQHVDGIAVTALDPDALAPSLKAAAAAGVKVISWDSDVQTGARKLFVSPPSPEKMGEAFANLIGDAMNWEGQWAWLSSGPNVPNQVLWIKKTDDFMKSNPDKFGKMKEVATVYGESDDTKSYTAAEGLLARFPELKGIIGPDAAAAPAGARAIQDAGKCGKVWLTGSALPSSMKAFVKAGCVKSFFLWNFVDFGYLTTYVLHDYIAGQTTGAKGDVIKAGRLGTREVGDDGTIVLGDPLVFDAKNVDQYNF
jgi:rhamnose transport system substrate-binding protein